MARTNEYKTLMDYIFLLLTRGYGEKNLNAGLPDGYLIKNMIEQFDRVVGNPKIYSGYTTIHLGTRGVFRRRTDLGHLPADLDIVDFKFQLIYNSQDRSLSMVELYAEMQGTTLRFPLKNGLELPEPAELHDVLVQRKLSPEQNSPQDLPKINLNKASQYVNDFKNLLVDRGYIPAIQDSTGQMLPPLKELDYRFKRAYLIAGLNKLQPFEFEIQPPVSDIQSIAFRFVLKYDAFTRKVDISSIEAVYKEQKMLLMIEGIKALPKANSFYQHFDNINKYTKAKKIGTTIPNQSKLRVSK